MEAFEPFFAASTRAAPSFSRQDKMTLRMSTFGISDVDSSSTPVKGDVVLPVLNHVSIVDLSYVLPSAVNTGSVISSKLIGSQKSLGACLLNISCVVIAATFS